MSDAVLDKPDYWYVTDSEGMKFFKDEQQLSPASWCGGASREKLERLAGDLFQHFDIPIAPIKSPTE